MTIKNKKVKSLSLLVALIVTTVVSNLLPPLLTPPAHEESKVYADALPNLSQICGIRKFNDDERGVGDNGTRDIQITDGCMQIRIINRANFEITYKDGDRRLSPEGTNETKVNFFGGKFNRDQYDDTHFEDETQGNSESEINFWYDAINRFGEDGQSANQFYSNGNIRGRWDVLKSETIRGLLELATMRIYANNRDQIKTVFCEEGDTKDQYIGVHKDKLGWDCFDDTALSGNSLNIGNLQQNLTGDIENFNITHGFDGDNKLVSVFTGNDIGKDSFVYCGEDDKKFALSSCESPRDGYTIAATPATFENADSILVEVQKNGRTEFRTRVGGKDSETGEQVRETGPPAGETGTECEGSGVLGWILCPMVHIVAGAVDAIGGAVVDLLKLDPLDQTQGLGKDVFEAWRNVRNVANLFFVIIFFIIIISQGLGAGLDAYNIRRMLPRLIAAAIAVQVSFYLMALAIDFTNVLGGGINSLIRGVTDQPTVVDIGLGGGSFFGDTLRQYALAATVGIAAGFNLIAIGPIILSALLLVLIIFVFLALRIALIYILVIAAPVAFVAMVLPNTESIFRGWWRFLSRALLMYPMIVALMAASGFFSQVIKPVGDQTGEFGSLIFGILSMVAVVAPLAFIPFTFQFAGGALALAGGALSSFRGRTLETARRRSAEQRGQKRAPKIRRAKAGAMFGEGSRMRFLNKPFQAATNPFAVVPQNPLWNPKAPGEAAADRALMAQEEAQKMGYLARFTPLMHAIAGVNGHMPQDVDDYLKTATVHGKPMSEPDKAYIKSHYREIRPFLGNPAVREGALLQLATDGYDSLEDYNAVGDYAGNEADHARIVHDVKRRAKTLRPEHYGLKVISAEQAVKYGALAPDKVTDQHRKKGVLVNDVKDAKQVTREWALNDASAMKTYAVTGQEDIGALNIPMIHGEDGVYDAGTDYRVSLVDNAKLAIKDIEQDVDNPEEVLDRMHRVYSAEADQVGYLDPTKMAGLRAVADEAAAKLQSMRGSPPGGGGGTTIPTPPAGFGGGFGGAPPTAPPTPTPPAPGTTAPGSPRPS